MAQCRKCSTTETPASNAIGFCRSCLLQDNSSIKEHLYLKPRKVTAAKRPSVTSTPRRRRAGVPNLRPVLPASPG